MVLTCPYCLAHVTRKRGNLRRVESWRKVVEQALGRHVRKEHRIADLVARWCHEGGDHEMPEADKMTPGELMVALKECYKHMTQNFNREAGTLECGCGHTFRRLTPEELQEE